MGTMKFYYNGIKVDGELYKGSWHRSASRLNTNGESITFYSAEYGSAPRAIYEAFNVINNTDTMTDYFEKGHFVVTTEHPCWAQCEAACTRQAEIRAARSARQEAKAAGKIVPKAPRKPQQNAMPSAWIKYNLAQAGIFANCRKAHGFGVDIIVRMGSATKAANIAAETFTSMGFNYAPGITVCYSRPALDAKADEFRKFIDIKTAVKCGGKVKIAGYEFSANGKAVAINGPELDNEILTPATFVDYKFASLLMDRGV